MRKVITRTTTLFLFTVGIVAFMFIFILCSGCVIMNFFAYLQDDRQTTPRNLLTSHWSFSQTQSSFSSRRRDRRRQSWDLVQRNRDSSRRGNRAATRA